MKSISLSPHRLSFRVQGRPLPSGRLLDQLEELFEANGMKPALRYSPGIGQPRLYCGGTEISSWLVAGISKGDGAHLLGQLLQEAGAAFQVA